MANGSFDPDGLDARDPALLAKLLPIAQRFNARYLRLSREGLEHVPHSAALFVSNHNGGIFGPDVLCTMATLLEIRGVQAPLYGLAHDFAMRQFTPLGRLAQRLGAIRATPENAARVFARGGQALVYPGGDLEAYRHSRLRDRILLGERVGFVRVAQRAGVPIIPIVAQGAHRSAYVFDDGAWLARALQLPKRARINRFPLALALPWGLALGPWLPYLPLPFRVRLRVLPALHVAPDDDPRVIQRELSRQMQQALAELARSP